MRSERSLSATAPKSLRGNRLRVFSFIAKGKASAKPIKVVKAYLRGTCHIAV